MATTRSPETGRNRFLGTLGLVGVVTWVAAVVALHFLEPGRVDRMVSEYAVGENGWMMMLAFFAVGIGTLGIAVGLRGSLAPGPRVSVSVGLLFVVAVGFLASGAFTAGVGTELSTEGFIHAVAGGFVFVGLVVDAFLLRGVLSRDSRWRGFVRRVRWFPTLLLASLIAFAWEVGGPRQRVFIGLMMTWLGMLAWQLRRIEPTTGGASSASAQRGRRPRTRTARRT